VRGDAALVLGAALAGIGAFVVRGRLARGAAALLLAFAAGALSLTTRLDAAARIRPAVPREATLEGRLRAVQQISGATRFDLVDLIEVEPRPGVLGGGLRVTAGLSELAPTLAEALPGARLRMRVRVRPPGALRNPGRRAPLRTLERAGIGAPGRLAHPALVVRLPEREGLRPLLWLHRLRRVRAEQLAATGRGGALLRALALGDRAGLSESAREAFARLGLAHLLAVSGLHLTLIAGCVYAAARFAFSRSAVWCARWDTRIAAAWTAGVAALFYALLAGWGVPVQRAWVVVVGILLALTAGRSRLWLQPLAGAAIVVLLVEPGALFTPGAQLSFAAAAALTGYARREIAPRHDPGGSGFARALSTSAVAIAATAPLAALHLGRAAPLALLANLAAIPWTALVLLPAAFLSVLCAGAVGWPGAMATLAGAEWIARATLQAVEWVAEMLPLGARGAAPAAGWLAAAGLLGLVALLAHGTWARVLAALALSALLAWAPPAAVAPGPPRFAALDVGQGDAFLVQGATGAVLVDAGTALPDGVDLGRRAVVPALRALGVRRLDLLIATHADLDHRGGIAAVLAAVPVAELWLPHGGLGDAGFEPVLEAAARSRVPVRERGRGSSPHVAGDLRVVPLWPPPGAGSASRNDRSLVIRVELNDARVLLPGDIDARAERALVESGADLRADVLALPHHGSDTSSSRAFLRAVCASVAVASAPCWGRFDMPHPGVLERAREAGLAVWWTGRDGAVLVALGPRLAAASVAPPRGHCRTAQAARPGGQRSAGDLQHLALIGREIGEHAHGAAARAVRVGQGSGAAALEQRVQQRAQRIQRAAGLGRQAAHVEAVAAQAQDAQQPAAAVVPVGDQVDQDHRLGRQPVHRADADRLQLGKAHVAAPAAVLLELDAVWAQRQRRHLEDLHLLEARLARGGVQGDFVDTDERRFGHR
jgi:competence protein ComEC